MSLARFFSQPNVYTLQFVAFVVVALVGLGFAVRHIRRNRVVGWTAAVAFSVLLIPGFQLLLVVLTNDLAQNGYRWADEFLKPVVSVRYVQPLAYTVGFGLLTVAIFAGRRPEPPE